VLNLFYLQLSIIFIYFFLHFPRFLRFNLGGPQKLRFFVLLLLFLKSLGGILFLSNLQQIPVNQIILTKELFPAGSVLFLSISLFLFELFSLRLKKIRYFAFLAFFLPTLFLFIQANEQQFPITDYSFNHEPTQKAERKEMKIIDFEFLHSIPYLAEDVFFVVNVSFESNGEKITRDKWPVILETRRNTDYLLIAGKITGQHGGYKPGFYNPVFVMEHRDYLELRQEKPQIFNYSRELQENLNTFMGW